MSDAHLDRATNAQYSDWPAVLAALERLERAEAAGLLRARGNWMAGEVLDHLARFMRATMDGFGEGRPPALLRVLGRLMRPLATSDRPTPKGISLKGPIASVLLPTPGKDFGAALAEVRQQIARVHPGPGRNPYIPASPLFGPLSEAAWTKIHLKHFRHHLGYLEIGAGGAAG